MTLHHVISANAFALFNIEGTVFLHDSMLTSRYHTLITVVLMCYMRWRGNKLEFEEIRGGKCEV